MQKILKKILMILSIFILTSCGTQSIEKVTLTYAYNFNEKSTSEIFYNIDKSSYSEFSKMCENKESFLIYIYNDKGCECYRELRANSLDYAFNNNIRIYEMDIKAILDNNTYGFDLSGANSTTIKTKTYLFVTIFNKGNCKYQLNYSTNNSTIKEKNKLEAYLSERIIPSTNFVD